MTDQTTTPAEVIARCPNDCERFGGKVPGHTVGSAWQWVPCQHPSHSYGYALDTPTDMGLDACVAGEVPRARRP